MLVYGFLKYDQAITAYNEALQIVDPDSILWSDIISNLAGEYICLVLLLLLIHF